VATSVRVNVPNFGTGSTDGMSVAEWLVSEGAHVDEGDVVVELETAKATAEVAAPASGSISIKVAEGDAVDVAQVLAEIELD
jgi:pyruvate/2-oxoglutarate dehydrogenase complex dihydrolipoamide acyltransferase (E2) component